MLPILKYLQKQKISVGNNYPYSGYLYNHTLDNACFKKKIKNLSIEIRNDLICDEKGIKNWSILLKQSITKSIKKNNNE